MDLSVSVLRELLRNLQSFQALYESDGIDTIVGPDGEAYCLHDLTYLVNQLHRLPARQREAIQLCLIENRREVDAAIAMGVSPTNPVSMYAASGLTKLIAMIAEGELPRFKGRVSTSTGRT